MKTASSSETALSSSSLHSREAPATVVFQTFGCKANQYDTERMRQELEARGAGTVEEVEGAGICVVNTCTVTNQADAQARRFIRKIRRRNPGIRVVVAGCSAALQAEEYRGMEGVKGVVEGHDPVAVATAVVGSATLRSGGAEKGSSAVEVPAHGSPPPAPASLVQLGTRDSLDRMDREPVGGELLLRRDGATRGWLKIQDGCDRKCSFCATRLARGESRSRPPEEVIREARLLARHHPELVLTGIHIGHYGKDLAEPLSLSRLLARLLDSVPGVRFRLGSIEATEVDSLLLELLAEGGEAVAPHLHMPLQSGADPVLRRMRRWHTREMYRARALEISDRIAARRGGALGLGADIITGFPGETEEDHAQTVALVEELPYTYVHTFPFSPRSGTVAAELVEEMPVPQRVAGERAREIRETIQAKGEAYLRWRIGDRVGVVLEGDGGTALTGDYLRLPVEGPLPMERRWILPGRIGEGEGGALIRILPSEEG